MLENPVTGERAMAIELPWWNTEGRAVAELTAVPGERFVHMIETMFGLAREGHANAKGMPHPLQDPARVTPCQSASPCV